MMRWPSRANRRAIAAPKPDVAPVTKTFWPSSDSRARGPLSAAPAASRSRRASGRRRASAAAGRRARCALRCGAPPAPRAPWRRAPRLDGDRVGVVRQPEPVDALGARDADAGVRHRIDRRARPRAGAAVDGAGAAAQVGDQLRVRPAPGRAAEPRPARRRDGGGAPAPRATPAPARADTRPSPSRRERAAGAPPSRGGGP